MGVQLGFALEREVALELEAVEESEVEVEVAAAAAVAAAGAMTSMALAAVQCWVRQGAQSVAGGLFGKRRTSLP